MKEKLKPCPFCGKESVYTRPDQLEKTTFVVCCIGCGIEVGFFDSDKEAIKAWNRRPK